MSAFGGSPAIVTLGKALAIAWRDARCPGDRVAVTRTIDWHG